MTDQDTSYPDPAQLRAWADEPMPFHDVTTGDLSIDHEGRLTAQFGNVVYQYETSYVRAETGTDDGPATMDSDEVPELYHEAWEDALDIEVAEDYVCATAMVEDSEGATRQIEAFWILGKTIVENEP